MAVTRAELLAQPLTLYVREIALGAVLGNVARIPPVAGAPAGFTQVGRSGADSYGASGVKVSSPQAFARFRAGDSLQNMDAWRTEDGPLMLEATVYDLRPETVALAFDTAVRREAEGRVTGLTRPKIPKRYQVVARGISATDPTQPALIHALDTRIVSAFEVTHQRTGAAGTVVQFEAVANEAQADDSEGYGYLIDDPVRTYIATKAGNAAFAAADFATYVHGGELRVPAFAAADHRVAVALPDAWPARATIAIGGASVVVQRGAAVVALEGVDYRAYVTAALDPIVSGMLVTF